MISTKHGIAAACISIVAVANPATATPITKTLSYHIGHFLNGNGTTTSPLTTLTGSFTVTFDPTLDYSTTTPGLTVLSSSYPGIGSPGSFAYSTF